MENDDASELLAACASVVDTLRDGYDWALLDRDSFIARTLEVGQTGRIDVPNRAAWYVYSAILYLACSGQEGPERRERGYAELFRCLYRRLVTRYPDMETEEVAQQALVIIYARFAECREDHAFFAFAFDCLWSEVRRIRRRRTHEASLEQDTEYGARSHQSVGMDPVVEVERRERWRAWEQLLEDAKQRYPQAAQQLEVVRLTYVVGLSDNEIAQVMVIPLAGIPSRRSRGLRKLREDPDLGARARKQGLF